jgi:hypothetical protein
MIIGVLSVICGADDFTEMEEFGNSKASFLKDYLELGCTNEQKKFPVFLSCETIKKKQGIGPKTCLKLEIINGKTKQ